MILFDVFPFSTINKFTFNEDNIICLLGHFSRQIHWRCITMNGMLFFIVLLLAIAIGASIIVRRGAKPITAPAAPISKPITNNRFKEEFSMEKETKVIKERVHAAENDKIERVAAAKVEEEIGEELTPLRNQLETIQNALNSLNSGSQQSVISSGSGGQSQQQSSELLRQLQQFSTQAQQQQQKTFQQLQQSIHQTTQMLNSVEQSLQSFNMLNQISQQITQSQQQLQQQQQQQSMQQQMMQSQTH